MIPAADYVKHVQSGRDDETGKALCGEVAAGEWMFEDPTHAFLAARSGSRLLPCAKCSAVIAEVFAKAGADEPRTIAQSA